MHKASAELGWSLVELIAVLVIMAALASGVVHRIQTPDMSLLTSRDSIIAALSHAQQIAMARDSAANPVTFQIGANSVTVQESGVNAASPGADYPFTLPNGVSITGGLGTLHYDKLGRTLPTVISLNGGEASITVEASGYAY